MARPTILLCALAFGCSGTIDDSAQSGGMNLTPTQQLALDAWNQLALPAFTNNMCTTCHEGQEQTQGAPPYLLGSSSTDQRDAAIATTPPVINLTSPRSSRVLVKGPHEGPALDAPSATDILTWINYEVEARAGSAAALPETSPYTMMNCTGGSAGSTTCPINSIDLTPAGAAGTLTFTESEVEGDGGTLSDVILSPLTITAGAQGLHVVHPLFGSVGAMVGSGSGSGSGSGTGTLFDPEDRFFAIDMELAPNATLTLGSTTFQNFAGNPLVVQFDFLGAMGAGSGD